MSEELTREDILEGYKNLYKDIDRLTEKVEELNRIAKISIKGYATLLWMYHGCPPQHLYLGDGERQCSFCGIDFLRDKPQVIERKLRDSRASRTS